MRGEYWHAAFWLLVVGSWVFGVAYGRWGGGGEFFVDLSQAVRVPSPLELGAWWQPLVYFAFTVLATFVLAQLFFGVGAAVFLFSRGIYDSVLITQLEQMVGGWSFPNIPANEFWVVLFIVLILAMNLPLCLWAAHLGTRRAINMWYRLRGRPLKPEVSAGPVPTLLLILAASVAAGLVGALIISYTQAF
ncbi:MAG: hypothetical protein AVW05_01305 [Hadesarchaea archaeon DG-33]|nr:MAG: hypothetical protein AVW05_01305 [Hadesarchaea archaeon DG-33]